MNMHVPARKGDWIQTFTGQQFWPLDPRPEEIHIEDIAHSLSLQCRYAGHCSEFYSVAQHSVLIAQAMPRELALWGLLHDAAEAYVVDVPRPLKAHLPGYKAIETAVMNSVVVRFGLTPSVMPSEVKRADDAILADEVQALMKEPSQPWDLPQPALCINIVPWPPETAKHLFLMSFKALTS